MNKLKHFYAAEVVREVIELSGVPRRALSMMNLDDLQDYAGISINGWSSLAYAIGPEAETLRKCNEFQFPGEEPAELFAVAVAGILEAEELRRLSVSDLLNLLDSTK